ncbi:MAG: WXG100 family type VII secretion target [Clostridiales bacterium]|nr:WXG100 family type VII secretion target [Clostridiales bacterium]
MQTYNCDIDYLRGQAAALTKQVETLRSTQSSMNKVLTGLGMDWRGEAATEFHANYTARKMEMGKFYEALGKFAEVMRYAADRFESADNTAAAAISRV